MTDTAGFTAPSTTTDLNDAAHKLGDELVSAVKQSQNAALEAARTFAKATSSVPGKFSEFPGADAWPDPSALTAYGFDLAVELLTAQKDFALQLAETLRSAKSQS